VTETVTGGGPVRIDDREGIALLREALERAEYTSEAMEEHLGLQGPFSRDPADRPVYIRRLPEGKPFSALVKLFLLGMAVTEEEATAAFEPLPFDRAVSLGLLEQSELGVEARVSIIPWSDFFIVSDPVEQEFGPTRADHVLNLIPPSVVLVKVTVRRPIEAALDLGAGGGVQSLFAAKHARRVVAADVNPRALRYCEFNAILNRLDDVIEAREGSLFEPVEGERFDLLVSNPPYVISPETQYAFRDSGLAGDMLCEQLVRRAPEFLNEGGFAHILISWGHGAEEAWDVPVRRWLEGSGCDALLLHLMSQDALAYASQWNRTLRWEPTAFSNALDRWTQYLEEHRIERVGWGALTLRRRSGGENWVATGNLPAEGTDMASDHVLRIFEAHDRIAAAGDDPGFLLDERLRLADEHEIEQRVRFSEGATVQHVLLRLDGGFRFSVGLDGRTT